MRTTFLKRVPIAIAAALIVVLVLVMGLSVYNGIAFATDGTITKLDEISVGHLSDIHYFPLEYCYTTDVDSDEYKQTDFYHSMTGDTKLVLESGITLNSTIQQIIADGKAGTAPQFLVASGDLSKNGERGALIDVANSLRYLQEEMRSLGGKYANFQVFATVGNHDLYNHNGAFYDKEDGHSIPADMVSATQFAMIFAGLGFPNATLDGEDGTLALTEYMPESYWCSSFTSGYVTSKNAENLNIEYYSPALEQAKSLPTDQKLEKYFEIGDELNQLTYFVSLTDKEGYSFAMIDSTDREASETGSPVRISKSEYTSLAAKSGAFDLYLDDGNGVIDFDNPVSMQTAFSQTAKNVYRRTPVQHITGGRIRTECLDWLETRANAQNATAPNGEETIISSFHHNVLPHFEQEDDILKDFTLYNWEYTAKRLLAMGIRYSLTGHMHASDAMTYTDVEGRTLYDFETGSIISYASPRRYISFERNDCKGSDNVGKLGETVKSEVHILENLKAVASDHIRTAEDWNEEAYKAAAAAYKANPTEANWQSVLDSNPDYLVYIIRYDEFAKLGDNNYNDFISKDIYTIIVDRMVDHFITQSTVDGLLESVIDLLYSDTVTSITGIFGIKSSLPSAVEYMLHVALFELYGEGGYPYNGNTYDTAVDYVRAIIDDILDLEYGNADVASTVNPANKGKLKVKEIASFIMASHSAGMEISLDETVDSIKANYTEVACGEDHYRFKQPHDQTYRIRMLYAIKDFDEQLRNGTVVDVLLSSILDPLFNNNDSLLKTLLNYEFDFSKAVEEGYMSERQYNEWSNFFGKTLNSDLIKGIINGYLKATGQSVDNLNLVFDTTKLSLAQILNTVLPIAKPLIGNLIGFNMDGDDIISIVANALDSYVTPSFLVGLGGIASDIVMAFATDVYPDMKTPGVPSDPMVLQPNKDYKFAGQAITYVSSNNKVSEVNAQFNAATQKNGRVPSRVTANFDTKDNQTAYTIKFYTDENIYGTFRYKTSENGEWITVSTTKNGADMDKDYIDSVATSTKDGITVEMLTQTKPVYLPLIDLGLLCLTHAEVSVDKIINGKKVKDVPLIYGERDNAEKNSVVYWNVTTVTVSGLSADTTYFYDILGNYEENGNTHYFSFVEFNKLNGYEKDYFTLTTAKDDSATAFEFLTIADIQGMIQGMYSDSFAAVKALLSDERTKDFDFILNAGDMCDNGKNFNQWSLALDTYQTMFANTSMFFAAGNHESGSNALANYFNYTLPTDDSGKQLQEDVTDGMFYSFNYANAHFVVLNTNDANSDGLGEVQFNWLKKDLESSTAKWKFVLMHKSVFSGGSHSTDSEVVAMRKQLVPLFANTGVNIVFGGHDHTFTSTTLIDANGKAHDRSDLDGVQYTGDGVLYITLGTMGTKFYNYKDNPDISSKFDKDNSILRTLDTQTFGKVVVDGDTITFTSYYFDEASGTLKTIGGNTLSANDILDKNVVIAISVVIPVVVIAAIVTTLLVLKKKGKLGGKKN